MDLQRILDLDIPVKCLGRFLEVSNVYAFVKKNIKYLIKLNLLT